MKSIRQPKRPSIIPGLCWVCTGALLIMTAPDANAAVISWPGKLSAYAGSVRHGPCHIIDILPTCLDAMDVAFPTSFRGSTPVPPDGTSLMPAVKGAPLPERPLFWEHQGRRAVYQEGWKLVTDDTNAPWELYDLAADPTEQQELTGVYSNRVNTLESLWDNWAATNNVLR